uniref:Thioredoxin-like fold n=1 Tax=Medicago truncatula TaxID=3880 RepID=A2Q4F3_MEDTR|nr:Thioredoxin-like fold [Medicago truncatula]
MSNYNIEERVSIYRRDIKGKKFKELLGEGYYGKGGLPKLFIEKKYIDEVEEIQKLHDDKKLEKLLDCCERIDDIEGDDGGFEACRDINFVPCETCYGSCKIYYEGDYEEDVLIAMKMA